MVVWSFNIHMYIFDVLAHLPTTHDNTPNNIVGKPQITLIHKDSAYTDHKITVLLHSTFS